MGHKRVVHVIDDESDVCEALKVLLHTAGMEARTYASAEEFLSEVKLSRPLCLLVDLRLPGMSGLDLVRHLQQRPMCPVVVMITGHGDVPLAVRAMRAVARPSTNAARWRLRSGPLPPVFSVRVSWPRGLRQPSAFLGRDPTAFQALVSGYQASLRRLVARQ